MRATAHSSSLVQAESGDGVPDDGALGAVERDDGADAADVLGGNELGLARSRQAATSTSATPIQSPWRIMAASAYTRGAWSCARPSASIRGTEHLFRSPRRR
jgi:hypothetical protein